MSGVIPLRTKTSRGKDQLERNEISREEALAAESRYNNVVTQIRMTPRVQKP